MTSNKSPAPKGLNYQEELSANIAKKEARKLKARKNPGRSVWFGLGMMGLVGWSVALPTIIGISIGIFIDRHWDSPLSCTLTCLFLGLVAGCAIAWYWIKREFAAASDPTEIPEREERGESQ